MGTCPKCKGNKKTTRPLALPSGASVGIEAECDECKGMGTVGDPQACKTCNGSKKTTRPLALTSGNSVGIEVDCPDC